MRVLNPIMQIDMPDPDVIRVDDTFYMVSTTMFVMPGAPILKSKDLVHWELISYIFNTIEDNEIYRLESEATAYGKGQWATSLKYFNGRFYACFVCHDLGKTFIYHTDNIERSNWEKFEIDEVFHDMSFLCDDDGRNYLVYGNGEIRIVELNANLLGVKKDGLNDLLIDTRSQYSRLQCEGCRAYKINGFYYFLFIDWPKQEFGKGIRREICYRSNSLSGPFDRKVIAEDDMDEYKGCGIAQGCLIDTKYGEWFAILFQDRGALGRIPYLMPVTFENDWPVLTTYGKIPQTFETSLAESKTIPLIQSDSFNHDKNELSLCWQWNNNPVEQKWSFTENPGCLRLHTATVTRQFLKARNTLTQKTTGRECEFSVQMNFEGMKNGDFAGLSAFQGCFGLIGIAKHDDKTFIKVNKGKLFEEIFYTEEKEYFEKTVFLKIHFHFEHNNDFTSFYYSTDNKNWIQFGLEMKLYFTLDLFIGARIGIFNYAEEKLGGYCDFKNFTFFS